MMSKKNEPPFWLDMSFGEAMARFARTDPAETKALEAATKSKRRAGDSAPPPDP